MPEADSNGGRFNKPSISHKKILRHIKKAETATIKHTHKFIVKRWDNVREVQAKVVMWILLMGLLIAATGFQMMWFQKSYLTTASDENSTYAEGVLGPVETLNPLFANSSAELSASHLMFSSLLKYDNSGKLNYDLASNLSVDESGKVYTISLKDDIYWHDGEKLTVDDVAYTIDLIKNPNTRSAVAGWTNIAVKVIDNRTISFTLPSVYAAFEHALTFAILPKHILKDVEESQLRENDFSQNPIGSGPFKFKLAQSVNESQADKIIYLVRNEQYYMKVADLEKFQLHVFTNTDDILKALNNNKINATPELSPIDVKEIDADEYKINVSSIQSGVYAFLNTRSSTLSDVNIRRALKYATNIDSILTELSTKANKLGLPFTDGQLYGSDVPIATGFDVDEAKKILDDNGWVLGNDGVRKKDGVALKLSVATIKDDEFEKALEIIANQWRQLGLVVETKIYDSTDPTQNIAQNVLQPRNYDVLIYRIEIGADPDVYAYWNSTQIASPGLNFSNYSNIISDDALTSARSRLGSDIRNAKYVTFAKQWLNDVPAIGLYQSTMAYVYGSNVKTYAALNAMVSPVDRYFDVTSWAVGETTVYKTP